MREMRKNRWLQWWDILVVTIILFGSFIVSSIQTLLITHGKEVAELSEPSTATENWYMLAFQGMLLLAAFIYLYIRKFDFKQWNFQINWKSTGLAVALFVGIALVMDIWFLCFDPTFRAALPTGHLHLLSGFSLLFRQVTISSVLYSLLNGFYEEIFFIGLCTAVEKKWQMPIFLASLAIRTIFHVYQGLVSAIGIGLILGCGYYLWYKKKDKNLYPIILSHAFADIWGLSLLTYFFF